MNPSRAGRERILHLAALGVGVVVVVLWTAWALWVPLYNATAAINGGPGDEVRRASLLAQFFPGVIPGVTWAKSGLGAALGKLGHVENLGQRIPIALAAGFVVLSGVSLGGLILRALGLDRRWSIAERIAVGFGLGMTGLGTFALLAGRAGLLSPWVARVGLLMPIVAEVFALVRHRGEDWLGAGGWGRLRPAPRDSAAGRRRQAPGSRSQTPGPAPAVARFPIAGLLVVVGPFLVLMALGAMLPTIDFDAIEYHLAAPKEYFLEGKIRFLSHNVYASMPFGVEMLHLLGMHVVNGWWTGALVGQLVVASFAPMAGLMVWLTASRWGSSRAAWVATAVYLTTPWVYRLAAIPYVEGPLCYYHAALAWAAGVAWVEGRSWLVVGLLAGGAMAIKYPAMVSAVAPFGVVALAASWWGWAGGSRRWPNPPLTLPSPSRGEGEDVGPRDRSEALPP